MSTSSPTNWGDTSALRVRNISKNYKLYKNPITGPIYEKLFFWRSQDFHEVRNIINDVSFDIKRGEVVGIVGTNGAGKTTLLKMIAGLLTPDAGSIEINGKITALLALGGGVYPEFTGRENILYSGLLMGMAKFEILQKIPSIIEFSELEDYIDRPFRTYSSGMQARLMFAISMCVEPDILIVDEALVTGDINFVRKCEERIREICRAGATVLFVSHNLQQTEELCDRCLLIEDGMLSSDGPTSETISVYIDNNLRRSATELEKENSQTLQGGPDFGTGEIRVVDAYMMCGGEVSTIVHIGNDCELILEVECESQISSALILVTLTSEKSVHPYAHLIRIEAEKEKAIKHDILLPAGKSLITMSLGDLWIGDGYYQASITIFPGDKDYLFSPETSFCVYLNALKFQGAYLDPKLYGRGALCEIEVKDISVSKV